MLKHTRLKQKIHKTKHTIPRTQYENTQNEQHNTNNTIINQQQQIKHNTNIQYKKHNMFLFKDNTKTPYLKHNSKHTTLNAQY